MKYPKLLILSFIFGFCIFNFTFNCSAYELDRIKIYFLKGDYKEVIQDGEKILAKEGRAQGQDELYYMLGVSYLKEGNFLRASDIFEIILKEFKGSKFEEEAAFSLGDTYLLSANLEKAQVYFDALIKSNPKSKFLAQVYSRLSQIAFKMGDKGRGEEYLNKLKRDFPLNPEARMDADLPIFQEGSSESYYTVQVGSFSNGRNAKNLSQILLNKGYAAYVQEVNSSGEISYRVRVGKLRLRNEAVDLGKKLSQEGYPTKIFP